ncbi:efflux RND transporter periplasmic adaptor subunit [Pediococcus acidilactici]|uniref:efflux RND transporter periplasmic adaptor subunit n=1 Tax=Pediococcus acidilactici TaxID=1254 RepID=UPI002F26B3A3
MKKRKLGSLYIILFSLITIALLIGSFLLTPSKKSKPEKIQIYSLQQSPSLQLKGEIEPKVIKNLTKTLPSTIKIDELNFSDGQKIPAGALILKYHYKDAGDIGLSAQLDSLNKEKAKIMSLYQNNHASDDDVIRLSQINKNINKLNNKVQEHFVYAQFAGYMQQTSKNNIEIISDVEKIKTSITEFDYDKLKSGDRVKIKVLPSNKIVSGSVRSISLMPTEGVNTTPSKYEVIVEPEIHIQYGFSTKVIVKVNAITVPNKCVVNNRSVFVKKNRKIKLVKNSVHKVNGIFVVKDNRLKAGDRIVINPKKWEPKNINKS